MKTNSDDSAFGFGYHDPNMGNTCADGLTKREYFIAEAMKGLLANPTFSNNSYDRVSQFAIKQVDSIFQLMNKDKK